MSRSEETNREREPTADCSRLRSIMDLEETRDPLRSGATTIYASVTWYRIRLRLDLEYRIRGNSAAPLGYYPELLLVCLRSLTPDSLHPVHPPRRWQIHFKIPCLQRTVPSTGNPWDFSIFLSSRHSSGRKKNFLHENIFFKSSRYRSSRKRKG